MFDRVRQWLETVLAAGQREQVDACVECGSLSPPGANRCGDCLDTVQAD